MNQARPTIATIILAAGRSRRMGVPKPLLDIGGRTLIEHVADIALGSQCRPVILVAGDESAAIRACLGDRPVSLVHNPDPSAGLSSSLRIGLQALPGNVSAAIVMLGDMPAIDSALLNALAAGFNPDLGPDILLPVHAGQRGNPVLWGRRLFDELCAVTGDKGGRDLIAAHRDRICEIPVAHAGIFTDLDTPESLAEWQAHANTPRL